MQYSWNTFIPFLLAGMLILGSAASAVAVPLSSPLAPSLDGMISDGHHQSPSALDATVERSLETSLVALQMRTRMHDRGDFGFVLAHAPKVLETHPELREVHHLFALALAIADQVSEARTSLAQHPPEADEPWGQIAMALIARKQQQLDRAEEHARTALAADQHNAYALNVAGSIALARGSIEDAAKYFAAAVEQAPSGAVYRSNLGAALLELGDLHNAREALESSLRLEPNDCIALLNFSMLSQATGQLSDARQHLETCLAQQPDYAPAADALFSLLLRMQDMDAAQAMVGRYHASLSFPELSRARLALHRGDGAAAARLLENLGESPEVELLRAFADAMQGKLDTAASRTQALLKQDPSLAHLAVVYLGFATAAHQQDATVPEPTATDPAMASGIFFLKGMNAAISGDKARMLTAVSRSDGMLKGVTFAGFDDDQLDRLVGSAAIGDLSAGLVFYVWQYHLPALETFRSAVESDPELALPHILHALAAAQLGRRDEVAVSLETALRLAPRSFSANLLLAELAMARGDLPQALPLLETAVSVVEDPGTVIRLGLVAETLGREELAFESYEKFVALQPDSFIGYNQLAWFLASRERDLDRAMSLARRADTLNPGNASINSTIGWIYHLRGDHQKAAEQLRRAFEISGWSIPIIGFHLAQIEQSLGNVSQARELLKHIVAQGESAYEFSGAARRMLDEIN
ncbi:tetratricopeptide repeat protein [Desulfonatronum thioautotrophicum]|uniref:tetratricopeptide repeat protein n=1 Tax=Desulfonatronum thioautotrophicum TaxID=617001 RepID=UPI0005EBCF89|nr:tetratricopeptide repeat protein [Desulfonatronum thioautotrophicum]